MERKEFQVGDRVRLREIDRKNPKAPERCGYIVGRAGTRSCRVLWSGRKDGPAISNEARRKMKNPDRGRTYGLRSGPRVRLSAAVREPLCQLYALGTGFA
jgi:hypothetical protein